MYKNKTFLAIIPARGGSKRLPRKNILDLYGKPLLVWSIEAGKASKYIDEVVVSSDDNEVLEISNKNEVYTIKRPDYLASDTATTFDAVKQTIENIKEKYDYIVLLQPTSPLRNEKHIDEAIELLDKKNADTVVSVCEVEHSPLWSNVLPEDGNMAYFLKDEAKKRSQDLEKYFRINGAIYICEINRFLSEKTFFLKQNIYAYEMDRKYSIDIDEEIDFKMSEVFIKEYYKKGK